MFLSFFIKRRPARMRCADVADVADVFARGCCSSLSLSLTFQLADLRLTVRPLLVTVHFILMKKSRSVLSSLPFLPKPLPETQTSTERGNEAGIIKLLLYYIVFYCDGAKWNNGIKLS